MEEGGDIGGSRDEEGTEGEEGRREGGSERGMGGGGTERGKEDGNPSEAG